MIAFQWCSNAKMGCGKGSKVLRGSVAESQLFSVWHTTGCIFSKTPRLYKSPTAKRTTRPPREYPMTLIFLMACPSSASSSNLCSISFATRSPPVSMPSYVKLPALRFVTRISSLSLGNFWRREVLTYFKCSGLPHNLQSSQRVVAGVFC
jgi:hypothetical protein